MNLDEFVKETQRDYGNNMQSMETLFSRKPSAGDWVDSAVIGGASLTDALNGVITDSDLDPDVVAAFHTQYPHAGGFIDKIHELGDDPESLQGLVNGVKGKLFEQQYAESLNDGLLPAGQYAELADSPVQPGWDIVIKDEHGAIVEELQLKMTDSLSYVRESR